VEDSTAKKQEGLDALRESSSSLPCISPALPGIGLPIVKSVSKCPYCDWGFNNDRFLKKHIEQKHPLQLGTLTSLDDTSALAVSVSICM
jgi:hypothetical protein